MCSPKDVIHLIPQDLKTRNQWVLWKYEMRGGKQAKVPYTVHGTMESVSDTTTWTTFEGVIREVESHPDRYSGIGFMFSDEDPYCGIDLDDALDGNRNPKPWAADIINSLNTYTEVSPSGMGCKLWVRGKLHSKARHRTLCGDGEIEVYDKARYFTITGERLGTTSAAIEDRQVELTELYDKLFSPKKEALNHADHLPAIDTTWSSGMPDPTEDKGGVRPQKMTPFLAVEPEAEIGNASADADIITRATGSSNGAAFTRLWAGDTSGYEDDDSRADLALCAHLAYWTDKNPVAIDRLFRRSGLYREKWERQDYRDRTIGKALERTIETFPSSLMVPVSAPKPPPDCLPMTDLGNARRLVHYHGKDIRHVPGIGWHVWTGTHWEFDITGSVMRRAKQTAELIPHEFQPCKRGDRHKELLKWAMTSQNGGRLDEMVNRTKTEPGIVVRPERLDADPWLLAVQNGTLDLRTGRLRDHWRDDLLTKISPVQFDSAATCPTFDAFMDRIFNSNRPLIEYVLAVLGHCLTGDISLEHLWVFYGGGANGKSTLLGVVQHIMGEYAGTAPDSLLCSSGREEHPTELADLQGRRLIIASETDSNARLKLQLVKRLTGEPRIKARRMRQDFYEFPRTHKTVLMTNNKPRVREDTEAVWRRLRLIPFAVEIPKAERDPQLGAMLRAEASGILNRLLEGCLRWQRVGLVDPPEVLNATDEYRAESDPLGDFLNERCLVAPNGWSATAMLYEAYTDYCKQFGDQYLTGKEFAARLARRGDFSPKKKGGVRGWAGVSVISKQDTVTWATADLADEPLG